MNSDLNNWNKFVGETPKHFLESYINLTAEEAVDELIETLIRNDIEIPEGLAVSLIRYIENNYHGELISDADTWDRFVYGVSPQEFMQYADLPVEEEVKKYLKENENAFKYPLPKWVEESLIRYINNDLTH